MAGMAFTSLRGTLLVAAPFLRDPNFRRAVVLLCEHGPEGAMGVILDRPTETSAAEAVPALGHLVDRSDVVHEGGPVEVGGIVALADFTDPAAGGTTAFGSIGFVSADAGDLTGAVSALRLYAGYSGWGEGQLEDEIEQGTWILVAPVPDDVFGASAQTLWARVLERQGGQLALIARMPVDPSVN